MGVVGECFVVVVVVFVVLMLFMCYLIVGVSYILSCTYLYNFVDYCIIVTGQT